MEAKDGVGFSKSAHQVTRDLPAFQIVPLQIPPRTLSQWKTLHHHRSMGLLATLSDLHATMAIVEAAVLA